MLEDLSSDLLQSGITDPKQAIHRMVQTILGILTHSVLFDSGPIRPSGPELEEQIFAIGRAVLLLPKQQENPNDT